MDPQKYYLLKLFINSSRRVAKLCVVIFVFHLKVVYAQVRFSFNPWYFVLELSFVKENVWVNSFKRGVSACGISKEQLWNSKVWVLWSRNFRKLCLRNCVEVVALCDFNAYYLV